MKIKFAILVLAAFGMNIGAAQAISVPLVALNVLVLGDGVFDPDGDGRETDTSASIEHSAALGGGLLFDGDPVTPEGQSFGWAGLYVDPTSGLDVSSEVRINRGSPNTSNNLFANLDFEIFAATGDINDLSTDWDTVGAAENLVTNNAELFRDFTSGGYYLVRFGTLTATSFIKGGLGGLDHNYNLSVVSSVPVPAAAWLFGTAILGLIGLRRKQKTGALAV